MTAETEKSVELDPKDAAITDTSEEPKRSEKSLSDFQDRKKVLDKLKEMGATKEITSGFDRLMKLTEKMVRRDEVLKASVDKERALRMNAESELETLRVKYNILELELQDYENEKAEEEDKRYESIEDAGEW